MRITHEADYAIRLVYALMTDPAPLVPASRLSEKTGVTIRFTLKILRKLSQAGIVTAQKGAAGGYLLAVQPEQLTLGHVIECIDGPILLNHCLEDAYLCSRVADKNNCRFHQIFDQLNAKLKQELYRIDFKKLQND
ncbi:MAG: Rrf2 family transcriptional regulator [Clostridia bacterium]|nr:Rrf2 family transcriptional regulator [Clostridia bacterium]